MFNIWIVYILEEKSWDYLVWRKWCMKTCRDCIVNNHTEMLSCGGFQEHILEENWFYLEVLSARRLENIKNSFCIHRWRCREEDEDEFDMEAKLQGKALTQRLCFPSFFYCTWTNMTGCRCRSLLSYKLISGVTQVGSCAEQSVRYTTPCWYRLRYQVTFAEKVF